VCRCPWLWSTTSARLDTFATISLPKSRTRTTEDRTRVPEQSTNFTLNIHLLFYKCQYVFLVMSLPSSKAKHFSETPRYIQIRMLWVPSEVTVERILCLLGGVIAALQTWSADQHGTVGGIWASGNMCQPRLIRWGKCHHTNQVVHTNLTWINYADPRCFRLFPSFQNRWLVPVILWKY